MRAGRPKNPPKWRSPSPCHIELAGSMLARTRCLPKPSRPGKAPFPARRDHSASPFEVDPKHTCEESLSSPCRCGYQNDDSGCKLCEAVANVSGERHDHRNCAQCVITDVLPVQASRRPSRDGDGTTGVFSTLSAHPPKLVPLLCHQVGLLWRLHCQAVRVH